MAPANGKRFSIIPSLLWIGRGNKATKDDHKSRTRARDDDNREQQVQASPGNANTSRQANISCQLSKQMPKREEGPEFSLAHQVVHAAREMVELRFWQDYGAWLERTHCWNSTVAEHVEEKKLKAECSVLHASERSCVLWYDVSQELEKEQKELQALVTQGISVGTRRTKKEFPYLAEVQEAVVRVFGRDGISPNEWIWELHEYVRRKMVQSFFPEYNYFQELVKRKEWVKMAEWLNRDLFFKLKHAFPSSESGDVHKMETAIVTCSNMFFLEFPRISKDGIKHFHLRKDWLDRPPTPPSEPEPPTPPELDLEEALEDQVDETTLTDALGQCTSNLASVVGRRASQRLRRGRPASFGS